MTPPAREAHLVVAGTERVGMINTPAQSYSPCPRVNGIRERCSCEYFQFLVREARARGFVIIFRSVYLDSEITEGAQRGV